MRTATLLLHLWFENTHHFLIFVVLVVDDKKSNVTQNVDAANEKLDAWTSHKTEIGVVYYYNALTGESTYDKPAGFKGEPHQIAVQPTPVSMVDIPGTDWMLVSTSDGKKNYYNKQTKTSCWEVPNEVAELKKQDGDVTKDHSMSVPNTNVLSGRGSGMVTLNTPAINTGGRDAAALKPSSVQSSPSALDLIKKKLQESGMPVASSAVPVSPVQTGSETNGSKAAESAAKGQDKLRDRERELWKRKQTKEQEMERVRVKIQRKEAITSFQPLLVETIKDSLHMQYFILHTNVRDLVKRLLKSDPRYNKVPRKDREPLWRRDVQRRQKSSQEEKNTDTKGRNTLESIKLALEAGRSHERR
ncbi:pre-mRNA-processing protein 40C [Arachis duranensis]|uniref:Pre-mRNA-processing protein 40C n=1 Tax=Arachis duranensis TaxID=130453 RepID=A0A9C6TH81_ARADU|nr:pre-mRNA-processing protein 40C [Arachis duranensis]